MVITLPPLPPWLRVLRPLNLLMMGLSQYLFRYEVEEVFVRTCGLSMRLSERDFFLVVLSTLLVAAGGYVVNDYFDQDIDRINHPERPTWPNGGSSLLRASAILSFSGIAIGIWMGAKIGIYKLGFIHAITAGLLYFYSSEFKRQPILGNVIVALMAGLVPFMPVFYEMPLFIRAFKDLVLEQEEVFTQYREIPRSIQHNLNLIWYWAGGFGLFAFLLNWVREMVKDLEDMEGDDQMGARTLPIVAGIGATKGLSAALTLLALCGIAWLQQAQVAEQDVKTPWIMAISLQVPLLIALFLFVRSRNKVNYSRASAWLKVAMTGGILFMVWFGYANS